MVLDEMCGLVLNPNLKNLWRTIKGIFTLNNIKIDLADRSKPKSKVTMSKNLFFKYNSI